MKVFFNIILYVVVLFSFFSCDIVKLGADKTKINFSISGTIQEAEGHQIFLDLIKLDNSKEILGMVNVNEDGTFAIHLPKKLSRGLYNLRIGKNKIFLPLNGSEKRITVNGNLRGFKGYNLEVKGSYDAQIFVTKMNRFLSNRITRNQIATYITESSASPMAAMLLAMSVLTAEEKFLPMHETLNKRLTQEFPNQEFSQQYARFVGLLKDQIAQK